MLPKTLLVTIQKSAKIDYKLDGTKKEAVNDYVPRIPPSWLKYDRKVLRFNAYFQEHVVEDPSENYRLRKCLIYYYLDDNTLYITEPKIENSGIPQGVFLKRQMVPKTLEDRNDFITWRVTLLL